MSEQKDFNYIIAKQRAFENGSLCRRKSWEAGKVMFARIANEVPKEFVCKMTSLSEKTKRFIQARFDKRTDIRSIVFNKELSIINMENEISHYIPTEDDIDGLDWIEVVLP